MIKKNKGHAIFFGWFILGAAILLTSFQSATFVYGLTAFMTPISVSLGWSLAQISLATTIRGLEVGALDPLAGMIVDRFPARRLMVIGTVIYAIGVLVLSRSTSLPMFYSGFLIMGIGGTFCYSMLPQTVLARWFKKNIGKVSGILTMGFSVGGLFVPLIVKGIDAYGWQNMMVYISIGVLVLGLPLALVFRNRPEEYGLLPDGEVPVNEEAISRADDSVTSLKQAMKMRAFWLIGLAGMLHMIAVNALTIHIVPYLTSVGLTRETAALSITIFSFVSLGVRLLYGIMADIFPKKYVFAFSTAITTAALVLLGMLNDSFSLMVIFSIVYAFGVAGSTALRVPITRDYFGAKTFGKIFGWLCVFTVLGGVSGAPLAGWVYDTNQTYFPIWYVFAGMTAIATIMFLMLPLPGTKNREILGKGQTYA